MEQTRRFVWMTKTMTKRLKQLVLALEQEVEVDYHVVAMQVVLLEQQ